MTPNSPLTFDASVIDSCSFSLTSRVERERHAVLAEARRPNTGSRGTQANCGGSAVGVDAAGTTGVVDRLRGVERYE
jgi:hypothetical protein